MTSTADKIKVMQAFEDGKPIEYMNCDLGVWEPCYRPSWDWFNSNYRIALTKPSWDWSHVSDEINYLFRQPDGCGGGGVGSSSAPEKTCDRWRVFGPGAIMVGVKYFASYDPGTCDWQDSLVVRPGYAEKEQ